VLNNITNITKKYNPLAIGLVNIIMTLRQILLDSFSSAVLNKYFNILIILTKKPMTSTNIIVYMNPAISFATFSSESIKTISKINIIIPNPTIPK